MIAVTISVSNEISIQSMTEYHKNLIKEAMTLSNPMFYKMMNMGKSTYGTPKEFNYWQEEYTRRGKILIIPRGSKQKLINFLKRHKLDYVLNEELVSIPLKDMKPKEITLRDYQIPIVESVVNNCATEGLLSMSTGSGKTVTSLEIIRRLNKTATILVPNNVILNQFVEDAKKLFDIDVGVFNGERKELREINVATFQTLQARPDVLASLAEITSILFIDEAQGCTTEKRRAVIGAFAPSHLFGLSGTPERTDEQTRAIFFVTGDIIAKYESEQIRPAVLAVYTQVEIPTLEEYHKMVDFMVDHEDRNALIAKLVINEMLSGRKILVLTKRIKHYKNLQKYLPEDPGFHFIDSTDDTRIEKMVSLKRNELPFKAIFGTTSLLAVGADIPSLDTIIIACDIKSSVLTTQAVGRILRLFDGKQKPKVIDLCDNLNPKFRYQFNHRAKLYRSKDWPVTFDYGK